MTSPGEATAERAALEEKVKRVMRSASRKWLVSVERAALAPDFTLGQVLRGWYEVTDALVSTLAQAMGLPRDFDPSLARHHFTQDAGKAEWLNAVHRRIETYPLPDEVFASTRAVLHEATINSWDSQTLARALSSALSLDTSTTVLAAGTATQGQMWQASVNRIARSEATATYNYGSLLDGSGKGDLGKIWVSNFDWRTRESHLAASGQHVGVTQPFMVGGEALMVPGDPAGSPAQVYNCRCTMLTTPEAPPDYSWATPDVSEPSQGVMSQALSRETSTSETTLAREWQAGLDQAAASVNPNLQFKVSHISADRGRGQLAITIWDYTNVRAGLASDPTWAGAAARSFSMIDSGSMQVDHVSMLIELGWQDKGIGAALNRALEEVYRKNGVRSITVYANIDVGGYAWARAGFDWDTDYVGRPTVVSLLNRIANAPGGRQSEIDKIISGMTDDPSTWPTPFDLSQIGWTPGASMWPGKQGLLRSAWKGIKWLI